jgi:trimethylamine--corrinoid protein Co-methyltransferase
LDTGEASLALGLIESISPGGHFLAEKHTRTHIRQRWIPDLTHPRPSFDGKPIPEIRDRAKLKFEKILSEHQPPPLDKNIQLELNDILAAAEREIGM